jgi:uncharacterized repeat protein (TIGR01451 family)
VRGENRQHVRIWLTLRQKLKSCLHLAGNGLLMLALMLMPMTPAHADLRTPAWYDSNAVITAPDWHYRVPISIPAGSAIDSTIKVDVDFNALLAQMGVTGTFDANSWRIVRSTGALATTAEFTDSVYLGATDTTGNARGEVRFLLQDAGPVTYYLYFDITQNGTKPANTQTRINGNFEVGGTGTGTPPGWVLPTKTSTNYDAQIRPSEMVNVTASPTPTADGVNTRNTNGTPFSGGFSYLLGWRTSTAPQVGGNPGIVLYKTITVPLINPGSITFRYRVHGWDSWNLSGDNYDTIRIDLATTANVRLIEMVGPTAGNYGTKPFSPNYGSGQASATVSGYRQYNGFGCNTAGGQTIAGVAIPCRSENWYTVTQNLTAYAGQTIRFRVQVFNETQDISWYHLDDVEWSVVAGTLGAPEAFGVNITLPTAAATIASGTTLTIRAQVNALATGTGNPVTASVYSNSGSLVASGIRLYDDGTHGDTTANDGIYTNNGSVLADPTYTIPAGAPTSSNWMIRVFARDAATSGGLAQIPGAGAAQTQANFWNIDEILFNVSGAPPPNFTVVKSSQVTSDPFNGSSSPKAIPGADVLYTIRLTNNGTGTTTANTVLVSDPVPANTALFVNSLGGSCGMFLFTDGTPSSSLSCNPANIQYSTNGGLSWTSTASPNPQGYDPAVTHVRVTLTGSFAPNAGTAPFMELRFRVRIKE